MTSGRGARACDAVAEQGCAGGSSGGATLELQSRGIRTVGLTIRHGVPYGTFLTLPNRTDRSVYLVANVIGSGLVKQASLVNGGCLMVECRVGRGAS